MSNSASIIDAFRSKLCVCAKGTHKTVSGNELGIRVSTFAQHYPPEMVASLANDIMIQARLQSRGAAIIPMQASAIIVDDTEGPVATVVSDSGDDSACDLDDPGSAASATVVVVDS